MELGNKLMALIYEIYLDGQYKERSYLQMQEIVLKLEDKIRTMEEERDGMGEG
jgi:hypothetical protein